MNIAFLRYPGTWLEGDRDQVHKVNGLLYQIDTEVADAAMALNMFVLVRAQAPGFDHEEHRRHSERRRAIEDELAAAENVSWNERERMDDIRLAAERRFVEELAANGELPRPYKHRLPFIHAKSFLYSLDAIRKSLETLAAVPLVAAAAHGALDSLIGALPRLADVRDSTAHADERSVGQVRRNDLTPEIWPSDSVACKGGMEWQGRANSRTPRSSA